MKLVKPILLLFILMVTVSCGQTDTPKGSKGGSNEAAAEIVINNITLSIIGESSIPSDQVSSTEIGAYATDSNNNPIAGGVLELSIPTNGGSSQLSLTTDSSGFASWTIISSNVSGTYLYSVSGNGASSNSISLTFVAPTPFITEWKTDNTGTSASNQITLPLVSGGTYNFTVYWGDGQSNTITAWNAPEVTHTYAAPGTYTVIFYGAVRRFQFKNGGDRQKILDISQWGNQKWITMRESFEGCTNLDISASDSPDLSVVTDMSYIFSGATNLNADISGWDVSNVEYMYAAFSGATAFDQDLSGWDTSSALDMGYMFTNASAFDQNISGWNTSNVTNMNLMFYNATSFNQNLSLWDVTNVTTHDDFDTGASSWAQARPSF